LAKIQLPNGWKPRPYQLPAWEYLENGGKHAELVWHRRSGKDEVALHRAACAAFERTAGYWHMLPEYSQARKAIWDAVSPHSGKKRIDEAFPLELRKTTRNQEMMIEFKNGSTWQVVGSDNFNSLVGATPAGIVYSEWALANPEARGYLRPIIAENNGWQMFITTPRGRNHAHRTVMGAIKTAGAFGQILPATETGVFSKSQLNEERLAYISEYGDEIGLAKFEQEYLCSFEAANLGAILARSIGLAEREGRIGPHVQFDPYGAPIQISSDIGRADSSTWWFWQSRVGGYAVVDYAGGFGIDADAWCDKLEEMLSNYVMHDGKPALGKIWLPHDARAKTFAAKNSAVEIFAKRFGANRISITPDSKKKDRVNAARVIIKRVEFSDKCEKGLEGLREWSYEWDADRKIFSLEPKHNWASHDGDGFSYGGIIMNMIKPPEAIPEPRWQAMGTSRGTIQTATLDEMWATTKRNDRI
jgi:phage terminase large subunit